MIRKLVCATLAFVFCVGGLLAEVVQGKVKTADAAKNTIVITADGKDKAFKVSPDVRFYRLEGNRVVVLREGYKLMTAGTDVKLKYGDDKVVTEVQVGGAEVKKKGKK